MERGLWLAPLRVGRMNEQHRLGECSRFIQRSRSVSLDLVWDAWALFITSFVRGSTSKVLKSCYRVSSSFLGSQAGGQLFLLSSHLKDPTSRLHVESQSCEMPARPWLS